jgi:hypothetical protein
MTKNKKIKYLENEVNRLEDWRKDHSKRIQELERQVKMPIKIDAEHYQPMLLQTIVMELLKKLKLKPEWQPQEIKRETVTFKKQ